MEPEEVGLYECPYVHGMRASAYYSGINASLFYEDADDWEGLDELLALLQKKALELGANSVVGIDITLDPFAIEGEETGLRVSAIGTPCVLEPLY